MADQKISDLTEELAPGDSDMLPIDVSGVTKKVSVLTLRGSGDFTEFVKPADETVTNNSTPQDSTDFAVALDAGHFIVEFFVIYSGNNTSGDMKWEFSLSANLGDASEWIGRHTTPSTSLTVTDASAIGGNAGGSAFYPFGSGTAGVGATHDIRPMLQGKFAIRVPSGGATLRFRFSQATSGSGRETIVYAGSIIRYKQIL